MAIGKVNERVSRAVESERMLAEANGVLVAFVCGGGFLVAVGKGPWQGRLGCVPPLDAPGPRPANGFRSRFPKRSA
jgi:hypothetical protein